MSGGNCRRLIGWDREKAERKQVTRPAPTPKMVQRQPEQKAAQAEAPQKIEKKAASPPPKAESSETLEERVKELEVAKTAQEDAVRSIIRSSLSTMGSRINEFVSLGGSLEVTAGRSSDFSDTSTDSITVSTAEVDLEVRANEWMVGDLTLAFQSGTSTLFPTTPGFNTPATTGVDRITLDKGYITIGDVQRFPLYAKTGLDYLPFGVSTGVHRADVLSIVNPLTIEAFEMRNPSIGIGFGLPTPALAPSPPPVVVPPVRPLVVTPSVSWLARHLGYQPPPVQPKPPTPVTFPPEPPPFYGIINVYDPSAPDVPSRRFASAINGRLGYRTRGNCGRAYSDLKTSYFCPWSFDINVDYDSSVFDSLFLQPEYLPFLSQIGTVPGLAGSVKMSFGPFALVGEWNGALRAAKFVDGAGSNVRITPSAWQASLGYQFDWNPWVEAIGAQGDYVAIGYSRTSDLAGVVQLVGSTPTRVGFLPQSRLTLTAGEWVLDNAKLAMEYSHNWDYPTNKGGTGKQADGVFMALTYNW
jgi:hypothetical protein